MSLNATYPMSGAGPLLFSWLDHTAFALMLAASGAVGVYYGILHRKENTAKKDYLHGGKSMGVWPIAISQTASHISGTMLVGVPAEVYMYGSLFFWSSLSSVFVAVAIHYVYLPVFFELQVTSAYEYLERRYNKTLRTIASGLYAINIILHMPLFIYVPALVYNQVSGINVHVISPIVCAVCIFYTMLGGLKAVVWTDVIQSVVGLGACLAVLGLGLYTAGGPLEVLRVASEGGRASIFEMTPDPFVRCSFWSVLVGSSIGMLAGRAINQDIVQRFIALPDIKKAKSSLLGFTIGHGTTNLICVFTGLLVYSLYHGCDPVRSQVIRKPDQLLGHYVMDVASNVPALPGLFVAGVFSAALSSMSSAMNALAGTVYEDFVQPLLPEKVSDIRVNLIMKTIVFVVGIISCVLVLVVERLGTVLELAVSISGIANGALLGTFTLGMLFPWANWKGAAIGSVCGMSLVTTIMVGAQHAFATGRMAYPRLPTSIEMCPANVTAAIMAAVTTTTTPRPEAAESVPVIFRLSYLYYTLVGTLVVMVVGAIASFATGATNPRTLDPVLLAPQLRWLTSKTPHKKPEIQKQDEEAGATELLVRNHDLAVPENEVDKKTINSNSTLPH